MIINVLNISSGDFFAMIFPIFSHIRFHRVGVTDAVFIIRKFVHIGRERVSAINGNKFIQTVQLKLDTRQGCGGERRENLPKHPIKFNVMTIMNEQ